MGLVKVDTHKREKALENKYQVATMQGVQAFLKHLPYLREARLNGDIDAAVLLLDFFDAYNIAPLSKRETETLYHLYELGCTRKEASKKMGISVDSVVEYMGRGALKIAAYLADTEGYSLEVH